MSPDKTTGKLQGKELDAAVEANSGAQSSKAKPPTKVVAQVVEQEPAAELANGDADLSRTGGRLVCCSDPCRHCPDMQVMIHGMQQEADAFPFCYWIYDVSKSSQDIADWYNSCTGTVSLNQWSSHCETAAHNIACVLSLQGLGMSPDRPLQLA